MKKQRTVYWLTCEPDWWWDTVEKYWRMTPSINSSNVRTFKTLRQARSGAMGAINLGAFKTRITCQYPMHFKQWIWEPQDD